MRHVIYILLVVNLVYFSWNMLRSMPHEGGANLIRHMPTSARQLETIQEHAAMNASDAPESVRDTGGDSPALAGPQEKQSDVAPPEMEDIRRVETQAALETIQQKAAKSASDAPESVRDTGGDAAVVAVPREYGNSVESPETADLRRVGTLTASEPPGAVAPASSCYALGSFRDEEELKAVENRLNQLGYEPRERTGDIRVESGYWVYLPAMQREEVLRITHMLDENNDRDYLIVKDNALSLGVYDSHSRVDIRLKMLHKYGLEPAVEPRYTTRKAYWLDLELLGGERAALETIRGEYENVEVQEAACR